MGTDNTSRDGNGAAIGVFSRQMTMGVSLVQFAHSSLQTQHVMISATVSVFIVIAQRIVCLSKMFELGGRTCVEQSG